MHGTNMKIVTINIRLDRHWSINPSRYVCPISSSWDATSTKYDAGKHPLPENLYCVGNHMMGMLHSEIPLKTTTTTVLSPAPTGSRLKWWHSKARLRETFAYCLILYTVYARPSRCLTREIQQRWNVGCALDFAIHKCATFDNLQYVCVPQLTTDDEKR